MNKINIIYNEDCLEVLKRLGDNSIDAIVTDPPYGLEFMGKDWDKLWDKRKDTDYKRKGFGKSVLAAPVYQAGKQAQDFHYKWATECLRVLKPGGNLLSFGGTRTYHRMVCAIEDAGFEIRDCIMYCFGVGFPKSLNIGKAVDKKLGNEREDLGKSQYATRASQSQPYGQGSQGAIDIRRRTKGNSEWEGYGTGLKPAYEPICLARKPISEKTIAENCLKWGVGGLNIDGCRIGMAQSDIKNRQSRNGKSNPKLTIFGNESGSIDFANAIHSQGRFPANFIHDGSQEVMELFPESKSATNKKATTGGYIFSQGKGIKQFENGAPYAGDSGSAARFFYCAKASKKERNMGCEDLPLGEPPASARSKPAEGRKNALGEPRQNNHPTVKPLALMEYLVKLVTRPGHIVLDPFIGSGTTAMACVKLGRHYIGCELDKGYYDIAIKRIAHLANNKVYGRIRL